MLTEERPRFTEQWRQKGLEEGRKKGRKEGRKEGREEGIQIGQSTVLKRLLMRRFGALSPEVQARIESATPTQLETWSLNVLDAQTLDDVFRS